MRTAWSSINRPTGRRARARPRPLLVVALALGTAMIVAGGVGLPEASAAITPTVQLGAATAFAVLAHSTITNTGTGTTVSGDVGLSPGTTIAAFPPGQIINGTKHDDDAVAGDAQTALTAAYLDAAGRTPFTATSATLAGQTLPAGVYKASSSLGLVGTVTLNGHGDPTAVFIFQVGSTLTTHSSSTVALVGTAQACNVFWQVTSSATLGTTSTFVGTVMALASVTLTSGVHVAGRVLARTGAVTLITDVITKPACITPLATSTSTTTTTTAPPVATAPSTGTTASGGSAASSGGSAGSGAASTGTSAAGSTAASTGTGVAGSTGSGSGASAVGTTAGTVVPTGAPQTGAGGASWSGDDPLLVGGGVLALIGAGGAAVLAVRRRGSPASRPEDGVDPGA